MELPEVLRELKEAFGAESAGLWYLKKDGMLHLCGSCGAGDLSGRCFSKGEGLCGKALELGEGLCLDIVEAEEAVLALSPAARAALALPVEQAGVPLGVLHLTAGGIGAFGGDAEERLRPWLAKCAAFLEPYGENTPAFQTLFGRLLDVTVTEPDGRSRRTRLSGVELELYQGEHICVLGPRGSGKSSLCDALLAMETPDQGQYLVDGEDLFRRSEDGRRKFRREQVGFITWEEGLMEDLTVEENLALVMGHDRKVLSEALEQAGLGWCRGDLPHTLSQATKLMAELVRGKRAGVRLLVTDEAAADLGEGRETFLERLFAPEDRPVQPCVVAVSAEEEGAELADRVIYLENGILWGMVRNPG